MTSACDTSSRPFRRALTAAGLVGAGALAWACSAPKLAAPAYMDKRYQAELKAGAPSEGAPIPAGTPRGPGSLAGVWFNADLPQASAAGTGVDDEPVLTAEGAPVPLQPWATKIMVERAADEADGHPYADAHSRCLPAGIPEMMLEPRLAGIRILEDPRSVTVLFEQFNNWRQIFITDRHRADAEPAYMGDSIGHWDGDVFVVETTNIDRAVEVEGFPHTEALRVIERFRRVSPDRLELKVTVEDPGAFTRPWSLPRRTLKLDPDAKLPEALCTNRRNEVDATGKIGVALQGGKAGASR